MSKHDNEPKKLVGPWRNIHGAVWLIGLAILALKGWWWPGILVLVALSMLLEAALMKFAPTAFEENSEQEQSPTPLVAPPTPGAPPSPAEPTSAENRADLLPTNCPKCGAPTRGHEVKWSSPRSADCPFCGANLPLGK